MTSTMAALQETYLQQGYLSGLNILNETELREARQRFSDLEDEFGKEHTTYSLHNIHLQYQWVMGLAKHPCVLEVVQAILGPDVLLLDSRFICKYPLPRSTISTNTKEDGEPSGAELQEDELPYVAWHQDIRYWGIAGGPVLSMWLALDDSVKENGALKVIPGSHCAGMVYHRQAVRPGNMLTVNQEIPEELVDAEKAILCPLRAGQMSIHEGHLIHASDPNMSQMRRCGLVVRYVSPSAYPTEDPDRPRKFCATFLVSGTDQFQNFSSKVHES